MSGAGELHEMGKPRWVGCHFRKLGGTRPLDNYEDKRNLGGAITVKEKGEEKGGSYIRLDAKSVLNGNPSLGRKNSM